MAIRKTIRMPKADLELVLEVLRSPLNKNKQGTGSLFVNGGYCCLGAMQCAKTGGFVEMEDDEELYGIDAPSKPWLASVGWMFKTCDGKETSNPYLPSLKTTAILANDEQGYSFAKIADAIEKATTTY